MIRKIVGIHIGKLIPTACYNFYFSTFCSYVLYNFYNAYKLPFNENFKNLLIYFELKLIYGVV